MPIFNDLFGHFFGSNLTCVTRYISPNKQRKFGPLPVTVATIQRSTVPFLAEHGKNAQVVHHIGACLLGSIIRITHSGQFWSNSEFIFDSIFTINWNLVIHSWVPTKRAATGQAKRWENRSKVQFLFYSWEFYFGSGANSQQPTFGHFWSFLVSIVIHFYRHWSTFWWTIERE